MLDNDSDIVIMLKAKNGTLTSPNVRVFVKDGENYIRVGLIQEISFKANAIDYPVEMDVTFPLDNEKHSYEVKSCVKKYGNLLAEKGCKVKLLDNSIS